MNDYELSETYRKQAALIRWGVVTGVDLSDAAAPRVTCAVGGLDTDWLPWFAVRAGKTVHWSAPTVDEQVLVFAPGGETSLGFVLPGFYSANVPAPSTDPNVDMTQYPDGSTVEYDSGSNTLTVNVTGAGNVVVNCKVATVNAPTSVTLNTPETHITGNVQIDGNLGVDGVMAVQGTGSTTGSVSTFAGTIRVSDGDVDVTNGDVTADSVGLKTHTHTDPQGGTVGPAQG